MTLEDADVTVSTTPTAATRDVFALGEGPVWDHARERLLWVDIIAGAVHEGRLDGGLVEVVATHHLRDEIGMVTNVQPCVDGSLLVAGQEELALIGAKSIRRGPRVLPACCGRRCNDGAVDPAGRFLVGTLAFAGSSQHEQLLRLGADGAVEVVDNDLTLSNGLAWSGDGSLMYSVDTARRVVFVRDYDPPSGDIGPRREHLRLRGGYPDGCAVDADDHLWVAIWGAGEVRRFSPEGVEVDRIVVPAPHTSSVTFAGPDLNVLVVTTATEGLDDAQLAAFPDSGRLFTVPVRVPGRRAVLWTPPSAGFAPL